MDKTHGQAEPRRGRLERSQQLAVVFNPVRQAIKVLRRAVGLQQAWRQSSKAGRGTGITPPLRPGGTFPLHHNPPFGWIATGTPLPKAETAISACK